MSRTECITSFLIAFIAMFFGTNKEIITLLYGMLILMGFDIVTGVIKSGIKKQISSMVWQAGIMKKISMLLLVSLCYFIDSYHILNINVSLESSAIAFFCTGEVISIVENFIGIGIPIPSALANLLQTTEKQFQNVPPNTDLQTVDVKLLNSTPEVKDNGK